MGRCLSLLLRRAGSGGAGVAAAPRCVSGPLLPLRARKQRRRRGRYVCGRPVLQILPAGGLLPQTVAAEGDRRLAVGETAVLLQTEGPIHRRLRGASQPGTRRES